jgi:transcriptional regulator with XRE-family HTH domain
MDAKDATPRARAVWAYSLKKQKEFAEDAGISYNRLRAILSETNTTSVELTELYKLATAAGVPTRFMDLGFVPLKVVGTPLQSALESIERRISALEEQVQHTLAVTGQRTPATVERELSAGARRRKQPQTDSGETAPAPPPAPRGSSAPPRKRP